MSAAASKRKVVEIFPPVFVRIAKVSHLVKRSQTTAGEIILFKEKENKQKKTCYSNKLNDFAC